MGQFINRTHHSLSSSCECTYSKNSN